MGVTVGFSLQQFSEVFKVRNAAGQPYLLISSAFRCFGALCRWNNLMRFATTKCRHSIESYLGRFRHEHANWRQKYDWS